MGTRKHIMRVVRKYNSCVEKSDKKNEREFFSPLVREKSPNMEEEKKGSPHVREYKPHGILTLSESMNVNEFE